jgi:hypothetical protein
MIQLFLKISAFKIRVADKVSEIPGSLGLTCHELKVTLILITRNSDGRRGVSKGVKDGWATTPETAIRPQDRRVARHKRAAGHKRVGHGRPLRYFRESMATSCHAPLESWC